MVNYQSRAQVPAPCVGKAQRPPVLQVSTIQTPGERGGPPGRGRGSGVPPPPPRLAQLRAFSSAASAARLDGVQTRVPGAGRESSGVGSGVGSELGEGRGLRYVIYGLHLKERGVGEVWGLCTAQLSFKAEGRGRSQETRTS